jgi:hypothetical protein
MYGGCSSAISTECYESKIKVNTLSQRFCEAAFRRCITAEYGPEAYLNIKEETYNYYDNNSN